MLLFFVPGAKAMSAQLLQEHGLDFLDGKTVTRETFRGPRGAGLLIAHNSVAAEQLAYHADKQTWSTRFGKTSLVGTYNEGWPVTPESLARENQLPGPSVTLLDGNEWQIPRLREWRLDDTIVAEHKLPRVISQSQTSGQFILGQVIPKYRDLWEQSLAIFQSLYHQITNTPGPALEDSNVMHFACSLLKVNYRLDVSIISHLQLVGEKELAAIIREALDIERLRNHLKNLLSRRTSGGTNSDTGETPPIADSTMPTDPPSQN